MVRELTRPTTRPSLARLDLDEAALKRSPPEDQGQPRHPPGVEGRFWPSLHPHTHSPHPRLEASGAMRVLASSPQADPARPEAPSTSLFFSGGLITVGIRVILL